MSNIIMLLARMLSKGGAVVTVGILTVVKQFIHNCIVAITNDLVDRALAWCASEPRLEPRLT